MPNIITSIHYTVVYHTVYLYQYINTLNWFHFHGGGGVAINTFLGRHHGKDKRQLEVFYFPASHSHSHQKYTLLVCSEHSLCSLNIAYCWQRTHYHLPTGIIPTTPIPTGRCYSWIHSYWATTCTTIPTRDLPTTTIPTGKCCSRLNFWTPSNRAINC